MLRSLIAGLIVLCRFADAAPPGPPPPPVPSGGVDVSPSSPPPVYHTISDFDFQSFNLALNQEYIELDLFHYGLARFSQQEFLDAGLGPEYQFLIEYMADQEVGHAEMLTGRNHVDISIHSILCEGFLDFCQKLTRWGESELLINSITTEARQQMAFRQLEGLFPMAVWFIAGIPQAWAWTLLSPYLVHCPPENPYIQVANLPLPERHCRDFLYSSVPNDSKAAVSTNVSAISYPGYQVNFQWDNPGYERQLRLEVPDELHCWAPKVRQQPDGQVFGNNTAPIYNDTMFVALTDDNPYVTPYNLSLVNPHIVAGPAIYQAG
ncbi:hypothetical protein EDD16DRAFT_1524139 [Pisolithus croceorrhizus]|nr:hypothetical protein EDD16DRAFT_1524139 [Pisolithus croceorrhizus]